MALKNRTMQLEKGISYLHSTSIKQNDIVNHFLGTNERWEVVAGFINQHTKTPDMVRNAKETLFKAKELQHGDFHHSSLKEEANKRAYENLENSLKKDIKVTHSNNFRLSKKRRR